MPGKGVRLMSLFFLLLILLASDCGASAAVSYLAPLSTQRCLVQIIWTKTKIANTERQFQAEDAFEFLTNHGIPYLSTNDWRYECADQPRSLKVAGVGHAGRRATSTHIVLVNIEWKAFMQLHGCQALRWQRVNGQSLWFHFVMRRPVFDEYTSDKNAAQFVSKMLKLDAVVVFRVDAYASLVCPHCVGLFEWKLASGNTENGFRCGKQVSLTQFRARFEEMRRDLRQVEVAVTDSISRLNFIPHTPPTCDLGLPSNRDPHKANECVTQRVLVYILSKKYNFTIVQHPLSAALAEEADSAPWSAIYAGDFHREVRSTMAKQYFLDSRPAKFVYCVDKRVAAESARLSSLFSPLEAEIWFWILVTIFSVALLANASAAKLNAFNDSVINAARLVFAFCAQLLRQPTDGTLLDKQHRVIVWLLLAWSLVTSVLLSSLYEGVVTSEMTVPIPDKEIQTLKELLVAGYKLAWTDPPEQVANHFSWKFTALGMNHTEAVRAVFPTMFKSQQEEWQHLLENAGNTARLYPDHKIEVMLNILKLLRAAKGDWSTKCYAQPEVFEMKEYTWYFVHGMANTFMGSMSELTASGLYAIHQNFLWHDLVRRTKAMYFRQGLEEPSSVPLALTEKVAVVFWAWGNMLLVAVIVFILEFVCRKETAVTLRQLIKRR